MIPGVLLSNFVLMKTLMIILFALFFTASATHAQEFNIIFQACYGGSPGPAGAKIITNGEGFVVLANTSSTSGHAPPNCPAGTNLWFYQTDANGEITWNRCYGGSGTDWGRDMLKTSDNGFLLFAQTTSNDGDVSFNPSPGAWSIWVIKTDSIGQIEWERCYGGSSWEWAYRIRETPDGGYIFTGWTASNDGDISHNNGQHDFWVVKINSLGDIEWERCYGGSSTDWGQGIDLTFDGGYVVAGQSSSNNGDSECEGPTPGVRNDIWVLKLDAQGEIEWQNCYGGSHQEGLVEIRQTADTGYIFLGITYSNDGDVSGFHGIPGDANTQDMWVVKLDPQGQLEWQRCLGGTKIEFATDVIQLSDGGYLVGGYSRSNNGDFYCPPCVQGNLAIWLVKLSPLGEIEWKTYVDSPGDNPLWAFYAISDMHFLLLGSAKWPGGMLDCEGPFNLETGYNWVVELQDTTTHVQEIHPGHIGLKVYPNPATTELWLQLPENMPFAQMQIELYGPTGRLLYEAKPASRFHKIETAYLPPGLYLLRVWDGKQWFGEKVVVR